MLPKWAWFKFSITNIRKNFNFLCKQKTLSFEFYIEAKILHTENESLSSIPEMLAGILLSSHRKHNEPVVECARIFYQVVKFVRIAIHYHLCLLKKHGYDNVFNFSHSVTQIFYSHVIHGEIHSINLSFSNWKDSRSDSFPPLLYLSFLNSLRNHNT